MEEIPTLNSQEVLIGLSKQAQNKEYRFHRIYRNLCIPDMYIKAYSNIYSNKGSSTPGIDIETADGFSEVKVESIIHSLKDESYQANPVRRTYILKKNGKMRPLGIPSFTDRLIQEVCRMILEAIYEPMFSSFSHGFRPERSCHTALHNVKANFTSVNWFIEGDIKGCFDNIDHHILIDILRRKIADERFIKLTWKFLKAGYIENWQYQKTFSGTPQGGIVSPILANVYLNELDAYILNEVKHRFTMHNQGTVKENVVKNPTHKNLTAKIHRLRKKIDHCQDDITRNILIAENKRLRETLINPALHT